MTAAIHLAATTHFRTTLKEHNQPDVLTLHLEFLRFCTLDGIDITVTDLKRGDTYCTIELKVAQKGLIKVIAHATSTNFSQALGPTEITQWKFDPPPKPVPDFVKISANQPDENWLPGRVNGDILPLTRHMLTLNARGGFETPGILDGWNSFPGQTMDAACVALLCDLVASMSDTLLHNGGIYDAHKNFADIESWAEENPGVPCELTNSFADAARSTTWNATVTMDMEFKREIPETGLQWAFTRASTKRLQNGRMDLDLTICDETMEPVCLGRQVILVLDAKRRFEGKKKKKSKM